MQRRKLIWAFVLSVTAILVWISGRDPLKPREVRYHAYYYADGESLDLDQAQKMNESGWWFRLGTDEPRSFSLNSNGAEWTAAEWWNSGREGDTTNKLGGIYSSDQKTLQIIIDRKNSSVLQRVAHARRIEAIKGLRIFKRGTCLVCSAEYPEFYSVQPFAQALNRYFAQEARNELEAALLEKWTPLSVEEQWNELRSGPSYTSEWYAQTSWHIVSINERSCSMLEDASSYAGGVHGISLFITRNLIWEKECLREVQVDELFLENSPWQKRLTEMTLARLKQMRARYIVAEGEKAMPPEFWKRFTFSKDGLRFYFDPYAVGPYADGSFVVLVKWSEVKELLKQEKVESLFPAVSRKWFSKKRRMDHSMRRLMI